MVDRLAAPRTAGQNPHLKKNYDMKLPEPPGDAITSVSFGCQDDTHTQFLLATSWDAVGAPVACAKR